MARYEVPPDLSPEEERAVLAALERAFGTSRAKASAWAMAGRVEALGLGALQARRHAQGSWALRGSVPFASRGAPRLLGRGDAK
jgi:hypothetical protein